jgi:hypothetical protein
MPKLPKLSGILSFFALFLFAVVAHSQGTGVTSVQVGSTSQTSSSTGMVGGVIGSLMDPGPSLLKGQPFSADIIDETDQFLADGNHIHREKHGKIFRDSEGRSRNEIEFSGPMVDGAPLVHITIIDPVQSVVIYLDPRAKTATVSHYGGSTDSGVQFKTPQPAASIAQPAARTMTSGGKPSSDTQSSRTKMQRTSEDLGTMEMEGFTVKGVRFTNVIPAGAMGNDKPMTTTSERWFSEELKITLLTKSNSPESGQHAHKLVNIHREDPDPLVFQVPADYTVREPDRHN